MVNDTVKRARYAKTYGVVLVRPIQRGANALLRIERGLFLPGARANYRDLSDAVSVRQAKDLPLSASEDWGDVWQELFDLAYDVRGGNALWGELWAVDLDNLPARLFGAAEALCRSVAEELDFAVKEVWSDA